MMSNLLNCIWILVIMYFHLTVVMLFLTFCLLKYEKYLFSCATKFDSPLFHTRTSSSLVFWPAPSFPDKNKSLKRCFPLYRQIMNNFFLCLYLCFESVFFNDFLLLYKAISSTSTFTSLKCKGYKNYHASTNLVIQYGAH